MKDPVGGPTADEMDREDVLGSGTPEQRLFHHEIRLRRLERALVAIDKTVALTERSVQGITTLIESRFKAFDAGQALQLEVQQSMRKELMVFTALKQRGEGAIWVLRLIGLGSVLGFVVWLVKTLKP